MEQEELETLIKEWKTEYADRLEKVGLLFSIYDKWNSENTYSKDTTIYIKNSKSYLTEFYKSLIDNNTNNNPENDKTNWEIDNTISKDNYIFDEEIEAKIKHYNNLMPSNIEELGDETIKKQILFLYVATFFDLTKAKNGGSSTPVTSQSAEGYSASFLTNEEQLKNLRLQSAFGVELNRLLNLYTMPVIGIQTGDY